MNIIKKDPKVPKKLKNMLDRYIRLPHNYQSKKGYDSLIQNIILKELINIMGATITDSDIKLKMKFSRVEYLESRFF